MKGRIGNSVAYSPAGPRQTKGYCGTVIDSLPMCSSALMQYWINNPQELANRLQTLNYRPARCAWWNEDDAKLLDVLKELANDGLIENGNTLWKNVPDLAIISVNSPSSKERFDECFKGGVAIIALVIPEDVEKFSNGVDVFPFGGNPWHSIELGRFIRDVLFQIRDRLYCGEKM